jgi:cell division protein FtsB
MFDFSCLAKTQVIQVEEELSAIERVAKKVEQANDSYGSMPSTGITVTSAAPGTSNHDYGHRNLLTVSNVMVELIQQFPEISATIEKLANRSLTVQVEFPSEDFPKETTERLEIISRCDRYSHAMAVKDHMLWTTMKEKQRVEDQLSEEKSLSQEYAREVASWAEMSQSLANELKHLQDKNDKITLRNRKLLQILRDHRIFYAADDEDDDV